jgi:hypothetical protein
MIMETREIKNPFTNAKIVSAGVDPDAYHRQEAKRGDKDFVISRSELCLFDSCPNRWINGYAPKDTEATATGSLFDCRVLDFKRFDEKYIVQPETVTATKTMACVKEGNSSEGDQVPWQGACKEAKVWKAEAAKTGRVVISSKEREECEDAFVRLMGDSILQRYVQQSDYQVMLVAEYVDKETSLVVPVKCLIDLAPRKGTEFGNSLGDFKTARNASPRVWKREVRAHNYDVQAAMELDLYVAATGEDRNSFYHLIQENLFPWQPARELMSTEFISIGRLIYTSALRKYAKCLTSGEWPGYDDNERSINGWTLCEPEPWMLEM